MSLHSYHGAQPALADGVYVHDSAQLIGEVALGRDCSVWCNAVLRGDVNRIVVGERTNIQDLCMGHVSHRHPAKPNGAALLIGSEVTVGHAVILHGCMIGDACLIGMGSIIMDDAIVGPEVILGAGSLVPPGKVLERGQLYVGRPALPVRPLSADELAYIRYSAAHYVRLKNDYLEHSPGGR